MADPPKLLYLGDVPVEATYHGSALLYRLLQRYQVDRLVVMEGNLSPSRQDRRLAGVRYASLRIGHARLLNSRFHESYSRWLAFRSRNRLPQVTALLNGFEPDAVMTVVHGHSWVTAARYAFGKRLPLHLVIHDDWPSVAPRSLRAGVQRQFTDVYRRAASRLCVSPQMVREFERRYGTTGVVLYPARDPEAESFSGPPERLREKGRRPVFAFAGTINSPGYVRLLRRVADALDPQQGELLIFGPATAEQAGDLGLAHPRIKVRGLLTAGELMTRLRAEADALVVPMSFAPEDRLNMQLSFPSKLTDYTAIALPLLICGPPSCTAVQWAEAHPGVAEVVTSDNPGALAEGIGRLADDPAHRWRLAQNAHTVGDRLFSASRAEAIFLDALSANTAHSRHTAIT